MTDQKTAHPIYCGLSHAAWGYLFLTFDFNLGAVNLLPQFVGYLLLLSAIKKLSAVRRDLALLRPLYILLAGWDAVDWATAGLGMVLEDHALFPELLITAAALYVHFQFLTDMAALAEAYQDAGDDLDLRLLRRRTHYVVIFTAARLVVSLPAEGGLWSEWQVRLTVCLSAVGLVTALLVVTGLFSLRRCFRENA